MKAVEKIDKNTQTRIIISTDMECDDTNHTNPSTGADELKEYRGVPDDAIEKLIKENYAVDYEYLVQNDPNYPSPEELLAVTKVGNNDFEGDVRFDTEGSE